MSIYAALARQAVSDYLLKEELPEIQKLPAELLSKSAGCFVSLHNKENDELLGCIGTIAPQYKNIAGEIIGNAIEAAFRDPRFSPITKDDLKRIKFSVDILSEPEKIKSEELLDPQKYGLIVRSFDGRTGLLLPDLDGIEDTKTQIKIAKEKAGIIENEPFEIYRFSSTRHNED